MRTRLIPIALAVLLPCGDLFAATSLPGVLVSATRFDEPGIDIPAGFTLIERDEIERSGARTLAQLLRLVPAIQVSDGLGGGGSATIDMRGFGSAAASNTVILVDGHKINSSSDASTLYLNSIDIDQIQRIEVIEGSAGTLYGNQAVGGLINIITRGQGGDAPRIRIGAGNNDDRDLAADLSLPASDTSTLHLHARSAHSDNYRRHNGSRVRQFSVGLDLAHAAGTTALTFSHLDDHLDTPGALLSAEVAADRRQVSADFVNDYYHTRSTTVRIDNKIALNAAWRSELDLALRRDRRNFVQSFRGLGPGSRSTQDRDSVEFNPRLIGRLGDGTVTLGADLQHTDYLLLTSFGPQGNDQKIGAVYAQLNYRLSPSLSTTAGLRHARVSNNIDNGGTPVDIDDSVSVGSLGAVYQMTPGLRLYARADQNYRFAKVDEHTNVVFGQPVGLNTQTGVSYESGLDYLQPFYTLKARVYRLNLKDEISNDATNFLANINLDRTRRIGLVLSGDLEISEDLRVGAGYEFIDSRITSGPHTGSRVPLVAQRHATAFAEWQATPGLLLRTVLEYTGDRVLSSDFGNTGTGLDAHLTTTLNLQYAARDWQLDARVNNLFNELYNASGALGFGGIPGFNPAPERSFLVSATYRF